MNFELRFLFSIILAIFISNSSDGQISNYFVDGSRWVYETTESSEPNMFLLTNSTDQFEINGDTVIGLVSYKKLFNKRLITTIYNPNTSNQSFHDSYDSLLRYVRFDSTNNEVYYRTDTSLSDHLILSFNLTLGDSLAGIYRYSNYLVDSIEQINLFGTNTPKYFITQPSPWNFVNEENYVISGIGGSNGLLVFHPVEAVVSGGVFMTRLVCFQSLDSVFLGYNQFNCPYVNFPTSIPDFKRDIRAKIYPNPFREHINISLSKFVDNVQVEIFNTLGKKVYTDRFSGKTKELNCELPVGLYFIHIYGLEVNLTQIVYRD